MCKPRKDYFKRLSLLRQAAMWASAICVTLPKILTST
jgi:hypothetical protein